MILKELEIQGFKSFPDRLRVTIDKGITGVVGPNGSGKSNISDAIRWVLGETSSKQLRGAGKMEDVIFGGTQLRGAMGFAMVRLTLDNADRTLDIDADAVTIGRKYYRSGESEYSINGQNCRLKDVYELFLDTGLGRDGYSIIGQGRIAEIVGAKSNERREIFEEASGIAKYRYRKNEAERRLASAEENLERLRDILGELEARVGPLEKESEKAQRFLELSARRKCLEVTLWTDSVRRARETVREQQRSYETAEADYTRFDTEAKNAEAEAEEIRIQAQRLTMEIERLNGDIRSITEEMSGSESRIAVLENDIAHNDRGVADLEEEIIRGEETREQLAGEIEAEESAIRALDAEAQRLVHEIDATAEELDRLQVQSAASGARRGAVTGTLSELTAKQTASRVAAASAASAAQAAAERLSTARASRAENARQLETLTQELTDTDKYLLALEDDRKRLANIKAALELKRTARKKSLADADEAEQRIDRDIEAAEQRLSVLRELEKNMDGYQNSVKTVMRAAQSRRLRGVIGPVSGILNVKPGCEVAIETALGAALQNVVVDGEAAAKAAITLLRDERAGRATFLPLDTVQPGVFKARLPDGARLASELVDADARYARIISNLLGRIVVVEDINAASRAARELGYHNKVVTMDGQVINAGGSFTGGSVQRSAGLFTRRKEIDALKEKILRLQKQQDDAQAATDRCKAQVDALNADITATGSEQITADNDKIRAEMEQRRLAAAKSQTEAALTLLTGEVETLEAQIAESRAAAEAAAAEDKRLGTEIETLSGELSQLAEGDDSFLTTRSRLADTLNAKKLDRLAKQKDAELHRSRIAALQGRTSETSARKEELEQNIAALHALSERNRAAIAEIRTGKAAKQEEIKAKEHQIETATTTRLQKQQSETEANARAKQAGDAREGMSQEMARLAERRAAAEAEYDQTIAKLWDEYQLTVTEAEKLCVEFESLTALRAQVAELRGKIRALGNVNVGAIDEYRQVKERFDAMAEQVGDVEKSKAELTRMIAALSAQMREMFKESFKSINENFRRIFRELFGGGEAALYMDDENDVLDTGIEIHVAPPGKVIKNLAALSGGEQALVAISIYFAILAVNPAPFCILDEIEAALDDANVSRYAQYLRRIADKTQFIVITHRRGTMEAADVLYGVTMQEDGVSKLLKLDLENIDAELVS